MTGNNWANIVTRAKTVATKINKKSLIAMVAIILMAGVMGGLALVSSSPPLLPNYIADDLPAPNRIIPVDSIASLNSAIISALPGDRIVVKNGQYSADSHIVISSRGTTSSPIVIAAESVGGAEIAGNRGFRLDGAHDVTIHGFAFTHSQDNAATTGDIAIRCDNCRNVRFSGNVFSLTTAYTGQSDGESLDRYHSDWLGITGSSSNIRIDNNVFQNKITRGVFLLVLGEGNRIAQNTIVDHNRFSDHSYQHGNGGECVRLGFSGMGPSTSYGIFEYNTFERCNGDSEAISVKSSNNIFRYNTFKNNYGSLVFRHGSDNVADGNIFVDGRNGIRAYGANQAIINNYFDNNPVSTIGVSNPIVIGRATVSDDLNEANAEYSQSRNILIAHNTLVGNRVSIVIGAFSGSYLPENITVVNNIITSNTGALVQVLDGSVTFGNNIFYPTEAAIVGDIPPVGYTNANPLLVDSGAIMRPAATSPAVDAILASEAYGVTTDVDGQTRSGRFDIGADEVG